MKNKIKILKQESPTKRIVQKYEDGDWIIAREKMVTIKVFFFFFSIKKKVWQKSTYLLTKQCHILKEYIEYFDRKENINPTIGDGEQF